MLDRELPLRVGDRVLIRNPGSHAIVGASVVDLDRLGGAPFHRTAQQKALGRAGAPVVADWHTDEGTWRSLVARMGAELAAWRREHPLETGLPAETLRRKLKLPAVELVAPLVSAAGGVPSGLPAPLEAALAALAADLLATPFRAPDAERLAELGLGAREVAAAVRMGRLVKLPGGVVLLPDAVALAPERLSRLAQPFTTSQARQALDTTRRVVVPLLELLDRTGATTRLPDNTRRLR